MKKILDIAKYIGAVGSMVGLVWAASAFYHGIMDRFDDFEHGLGDNTEMVMDVKYEVKANTDMLQDIISHQQKQDEHMVDMENAAKFYLQNQKEMTEDAMEEALEILLKKNTEPTVYDWSNIDSIYIIENQTCNSYPLIQ